MGAYARDCLTEVKSQIPLFLQKAPSDLQAIQGSLRRGNVCMLLRWAEVQLGEGEWRQIHEGKKDLDMGHASNAI